MADIGPALPLLVGDNLVVLPGSSTRLTVKDATGIRTVEKYMWSNTNWSQRYFGVVGRRPSKAGKGREGKFRSIGVAVTVSRVVASSVPESFFTVFVTGFCRFRLRRIRSDKQDLVADVEQLERRRGEVLVEDEELKELEKEFLASCWRLFQTVLAVSPDDTRLMFFQQLLQSLPASRSVDIIGALVKASNEERWKILETVDLRERLAFVTSLLHRQVEKLKLPAVVNSKSLDRTELLSDKSPTAGRQGKRGGALDRLIGSDSEEIEELERQLLDANLPDVAMKVASKDLKRLKRMPSVHPEHAVVRNFLELMVELPWNQSSADRLDIDKARQQLDADHYGLATPKKRVLEYLAVRKLKSSLRGPILCLVGPPGVGKTSIARSIAASIGREFYRISLGGVSDEADIRGHRRTYIGSMPGRIISGLRRVGVNNPVFLLDEVDKMTVAGIRGDPAAALLEVLDSEQNNSFTDHYLTVPFDLSQVLFIATANTTASIPSALKDRMEVIRISGYNIDEKLHIAERHLVSKQLKEHGIADGHLVFPRPTLSSIVSSYTREAGVRSLERKIGAVCRAIALQLAEGKPIGSSESPAAGVKSMAEPTSLSCTDDQCPRSTDAAYSCENSLATASTAVAGTYDQPITVTPHMLEDLLGPPEHDREGRERLDTPGVAMGLAWTQHGGELLFVEAIAMPGTGKLSTTGNLGDVMKESASLALSWIRAHTNLYQLPATDGQTDVLHGRDVHVHFPAGAISKDGPSAGITILVVLMSLFSGRCVRSDTAMTGEIALRGRVLAVGGVKEKVLAAHTAGIHRVILPAHNRKDVKEISEDILKSLELLFVKDVGEALQYAFEGGFPIQSSL